MFPCEARDAWVLGDLLFAAIGLSVVRGQAADWYIVDIQWAARVFEPTVRYSSVRYLGLENVSEVVMEYWY